MNGWCPYELREIDDAEKRAAICGVGVDEVRKGVKAIMLAGGSQLVATEKSADAVNCVPPAGGSQLVATENGADAGGSQLVATETSADAVNCVPPESRKMAMAVLKRGQWPKFFFSKNGKGGIARKTYLSAVGDVPPTNLFEYKDVGHTDEAKKEVLKVFDGGSRRLRRRSRRG